MRNLIVYGLMAVGAIYCIVALIRFYQDYLLGVI